MAILLAGIVACEEDVESCNFYQEHGSPQYMAGRVRGDANGGDGVSCVVVNGFNLRECIQMVLLCV
jgi:hypothetical protein